MVILTDPGGVAAGPSAARWVTLDEGALFAAQRRETGTVESALRDVAASAGALLGGKKDALFRVVTTRKPVVEIASANNEEEIAMDLSLLQCFVAGMPLEDPGLIPPKVKQILADVAKSAAEDSLAAPDEDKQELVKQIEPWAVKLLENSDRLRYVCYALKIAASCGAEFGTLGLGGEEMVQLSFTAVDSAVLSSWLAWFISSLADDAGDSIVRQMLLLEFNGGPRQVVAEMDRVCAEMRTVDVEFVTRAAMKLKARVAMLVGDFCSLFIPNDCHVGGAVITELLIHKPPAEAAAALRQLVAFYELIPEMSRAVLADHGQLSGLLQSASGSVRSSVMKEYERPLGSKAVRAVGRAVLCGPLPLLGAANLASSAAIGANMGKESCKACFNTVDEKMPIVAATIQRSLALAFGTLALLAHCADRASGSSEFSAADLLKVLPAIEAASKGGASSGPAARAAGAVGSALGALSKTMPGRK